MVARGPAVREQVSGVKVTCIICAHWIQTYLILVGQQWHFHLSWKGHFIQIVCIQIVSC
jgi:hypothetical protein